MQICYELIILCSKKKMYWGDALFFLIDKPGYPGQLARTTTIFRVYWTSCKPSRQVRHRGGDRHAHRGSNSERGQSKPHLLITELDPQVQTERGCFCSHGSLIPPTIKLCLRKNLKITMKLTSKLCWWFELILFSFKMGVNKVVLYRHTLKRCWLMQFNLFFKLFLF